MKPWMTMREAADYLGYHRNWLRWLCSRGDGPRGYLRRRRWRFKKADLDAWDKAETTVVEPVSR